MATRSELFKVPPYPSKCWFVFSTRSPEPSSYSRKIPFMSSGYHSHSQEHLLPLHRPTTSLPDAFYYFHCKEMSYICLSCFSTCLPLVRLYLVQTHRSPWLFLNSPSPLQNIVSNFTAIFLKCKFELDFPLFKNPLEASYYH